MSHESIETRILSYTSDLLKEKGAKYIMRPEFLLNYFAMSPNKAEVIKGYKNIFPSVLGLKMGHRMSEESFHYVLEKVKEWSELEPARVSAKVNNLSNILKAKRPKLQQDEKACISEIMDEIK